MHEMAHDNIWQITTLSSHETFTILRIEFITTTFNTTTIKVVHVIAIYKPSTLLFSTFINQLQKRLDVMPTFCPTVIMGDFNIDMFDEIQHNQMNLNFLWTNIQWNFSFKKLQQFMVSILVTYGQMHPSNKVFEKLLKHIGLITSQ
jgi:hypothetical protein